MVSIIAIGLLKFNSVLIIYLNTVKWLYVLIPNTNYSIQHYSFVCLQLNGWKYCYVSRTIQLNDQFYF